MSRFETPGCGLGLLVVLLSYLLVNAPLVTEGIHALSIASAPEHVLHRQVHAGAGRYGTLHHAVSVVDKDRDSDPCPAESLRRLARPAFARIKLIADEQLVSVQP